MSKFKSQLIKIYAIYTAGVVLFVWMLGILEQVAISRATIGYVFLGTTILLYAGIGIMSRTNNADEYYVAGRRVPAMFNGMATAADWMSAASFLGLAGTLYVQGYAGLAFVMGWTGGYVLIAVFLAPYLRKFGQYTIPDFLGARYGGNIARGIGIVIVILCSFTYLVAQIYGVGLITTLLTRVDFALGVFLGLAGILVCSFLGGMKAVTWTQVAQYIIIAIAYVTPVVWMSVKQTGSPVPQLTYGTQLEKVTQLEQKFIDDPLEKQVRSLFQSQADQAKEYLKDVPKSFAAQRDRLLANVDAARASNNPIAIKRSEDQFKAFSRDETSAKQMWLKDAANEVRSQLPSRHAQAFPGKDEAAQNIQRKNFLALVFCLMIGTAALPHILARLYTTPTVKEARESVSWSLFFIFVLYCTAPALAVLVKYTIYQDIVGQSIASLPEWVNIWSKVDPPLVSIIDINGDGILQFAELSIAQDALVLATPEIAGLPYVMAGLVAAGALAAALSTADGLLLAISNALSHDLYFKMINPLARTSRRVLISKVSLLFVAIFAAFIAGQRPTDILTLVAAAASLAGAGLFPALVLGVFWKRATGIGATLGMLSGMGITLFYMIKTQPWLNWAYLNGTKANIEPQLWWDIQPNAAGIFGVPLGFVVMIVVSLITPVPSRETQDLVEHIRQSNIKAP
jgi:cation/acetate symporter